MIPPFSSLTAAAPADDTTDLLRKKASFIQHSLPGLPDGRYEIGVQQSLLDGARDVSGGLPRLTRRFGVAGLRYSLPRTAVHSVFPPENGEGAFSDSLAHVVLELEKVPWLRSPYAPENEPAVGLHTYDAVIDGTARAIKYEDDVPSWLAVVLLTPADLGYLDPLSLLRQGTVADLIPEQLAGGDGNQPPVPGALPSNGYSQFSYVLHAASGHEAAPPVDPGIGQTVHDPLQYIDLPCGVFDEIAPTIDDLRMMAHIREVEMSSKPLSPSETADPRQQYALVLGNRLPESLPLTNPTSGLTSTPPTPAPGTNVGLLVSLESMEHALRGHAAGSGYDGVARLSNGFVRLVVMHSWRFVSREDTTFAFERLLTSLNGRSSQGSTVPDPQLRLPSPPVYEHATAAEAVVEDMLAAGFLAFDHTTRVPVAGLTSVPNAPVQTVSWYRGPLIPEGASTPSIEFVAGTRPGDGRVIIYAADQLLRFDPGVGMYDVSYAAAWQLGRMIALQSKDFSVALYRWKHETASRYRVAVERDALRAWYEPALSPSEQNVHLDRVAGRQLQTQLLLLLGTTSARRSEPPPSLRSLLGAAPTNAAELSASRDAAYEAIAAELADMALPRPLVDWLAALRSLQGIPFSYLVADERLLPPESIKFFQVDPAWVQALEDGALSIGRAFSRSDTPSPALVAEQVQRPRLHSSVAAAVPDIRRKQLHSPTAESKQTGSGTTGFLLRSEVVRAWKSVDVLGYAPGHSPSEYAQGKISVDQVQAMEIARLERLSPTVLIGLFPDTLYELVLHQPPEAIHFGFLTVDYAGNAATKNLRAPTTGWDDPDTGYDSQTYARQELGSAFANVQRRVADLVGLSRSLALKLDAAGRAPGYFHAAPDADHQDHLLSSDFALEMVQGVGLVSFINAVPNEAI